MLRYLKNKSNGYLLAKLLLLLIFIATLCVVYVDIINIQLTFFGLICIYFIIRYGLNDIFDFFKFWYKKVFIYIFFYIVIGVIYINFGKTEPLNTFAYWSHLTTRTILVLLNTVLFTEILLRPITVSNLFNLEVSDYLKMRLIMFISIYNYLKIQTLTSIENINIIPEYQSPHKTTFFKKIKFEFYRNLVIILSIVYMVQDKSYILGKLIENRFEHLKTK